MKTRLEPGEAENFFFTNLLASHIWISGEARQARALGVMIYDVTLGVLAATIGAAAWIHALQVAAGQVQRTIGVDFALRPFKGYKFSRCQKYVRAHLTCKLEEIRGSQADKSSGSSRSWPLSG